MGKAIQMCRPVYEQMGLFRRAFRQYEKCMGCLEQDADIGFIASLININ